MAVAHSASSTVSSDSPKNDGGATQLLGPLGAAGLNWVNVPLYWARLNTVVKLVQSAAFMPWSSTTAMVIPLPVTPLLRIVLMPYMVARSLGTKARIVSCGFCEVLTLIAMLLPFALPEAGGWLSTRAFLVASHLAPLIGLFIAFG